MSLLLGPLLTIATKVGAPILKNILKEKAGSVGGKVAEKVVEEIAEKMGVGTAEELVEKYRAEPQVVERIIRETEYDLVELTKVQLEGFKEQTSLFAGDRDHKSLFVSSWRPAVGYVFAANMLIYALCFAYMIFMGAVDTINALASLSGMIISIFTVHAAVTGTYVWGRTLEKKANKD